MRHSSGLVGKRVLLICPRFFGYDEAITGELLRRGAIVERLEDRPFRSAVMKAISRYVPRLMAHVATLQYRTALVGAEDFDLVLVINGQTLSPFFLRKLKGRFLRADFRLYLWDSLCNRSSVARSLHLYDKVLTFDPRDAERFRLAHRPLFFSNEFNHGRDPANCDYDISFIGTAHTDRWALVRQVEAALPAGSRPYWFLYVQARWVFHARKIFNPRFRAARLEEFCFEPMPRVKVSEIFRRSRAILDIEHPSQRGLTIRTIEAIGAKKKLITTNQDIRRYEFYSSSNVLIVERGRTLVVPASFLAEPYSNLPPQVYRRYSLEGWMDDILN